MLQTARAERVHIAIVGRQNSGKSSLINAITGQELSIVSDVAGTTTDPVSKAVELLPYGPVVFVDTAGLDDDCELGTKRISKTYKVLTSSDFAIVVLDATKPLIDKEKELFAYLGTLEINYLIAVNKIELGVNPDLLKDIKELNATHFEISCSEMVGIQSLKNKMIKLLPGDEEISLLNDIVQKGSTVIMVVPIDAGAPKARIIKPQVHAIREALEESCICIVVKDSELKSALNRLIQPPDLVITDSQAIEYVAEIVPDNVKLTTFSILMARRKGNLLEFVRGLKIIDELNDGDKVLIAESCTHHAQGDDIGTIKIPNWLISHTKKQIEFDVKHGIDFPDNLSEYKLIVHCGGCMFTRKTMQTRMKQAKLMNVPIVNYGVLISYMHGAVPRVLQPFSEAMEEWNKFERILM